MIYILIMIIIQFIWIILMQKYACWLKTIMLWNIILISLFAWKYLDVFGYSTNVGNIMYASAFICQMLIYKMGGEKKWLETIPFLLTWVIFFTAVIQSIAIIPDYSKDLQVTQAIDILANFNILLFLVSFGALFFSQITFFILIKKVTIQNIFIKYMVLITTSMLVDSLFFFTFFPTFGSTFSEVAIAWFLLKEFTCLIWFPFYYFLSKNLQYVFNEK